MSAKPFGLYVVCRRDGVTRDGGLHSSYTTREELVEALPHELVWLRQFYDDVTYKIVEDKPETKKEQMAAKLAAWL